MIIRDEQMNALRDSVALNFEAEMTRHVAEFSPHHFAVIGQAGACNVVRSSIVKASSFGFTNRGCVRLYIDLTFMFGSSFATDPLLPWAGSILRAGSAEDQMDRAKLLHVRALEFVDATAGPDHQYAKEVLRRARSVRYQELSVRGNDDFESASLRRLQSADAQKCAYAGEPAVRGLIREGTEQAARYSVSSSEGASLFVILMFAMGHGFAADPLFPWVSGTLNNQVLGDPNKRAERLYAKTMTYLDHVLAHVG